MLIRKPKDEFNNNVIATPQKIGVTGNKYDETLN
jgi:hypothetical protein